MKRSILIFVFCIATACGAQSLVQQADRLLDDDPDYNKKYPLVVPLMEVPLTNGVIWSYNRYMSEASFAFISASSIRSNFENGWRWDTDDFRTNFSLHPYSGSAYFNCARSNGYSFYESAPFVLGGSLMWEYFMETTRPSYNDLINTTISGIFLGETLYRLSSKILDDRTSGAERVFRELAGFVIDPTRSFNRFVQGKMFRVVGNEVYQKEPLRATIGLGARRTTGGSDINHGASNGIADLNLRYGDPYELRSRKPFDYFKVRAEFATGDPKHFVTNVAGDGFLFGRNTSGAKALYGAFQHYDYWNTHGFEIGTLGIGGGVVSRIHFPNADEFSNELHLAIVPLGASNTRKIPTGDVNYGYQNYTYSGGAELKYQLLLDLNWMQFASEYSLYWLHTYVGKPGDSLLGVLRPSIAIRVYGPFLIGYEYVLYHRDDFNRNVQNLRVRSQEQRAYLLLSF